MTQEEIPLTCEEKLDAANVRIFELEQALRKEIHFRTARDLGNANTQIWLPVLSLVDIFHKAYKLRNYAVDNNKKATKLIFTISNEGRIIDVLSEESKEDRT